MSMTGVTPWRPFQWAVLIVCGALSATTQTHPAQAQQIADTLWAPAGLVPTWTHREGPRVAIDSAHFNFHTVDGRYRPFADLLRRDGCVVSGSEREFSAETLKGFDILVIANALHRRNAEEWTLPTPPAFSATEVEAVREWVRGGGSLLLIADHMPFPGGASTLAAAFGFQFRNGFAGAAHQLDAITFQRGPAEAGQRGGSLADHLITRGATPGEGVDSLTSFTGSAFQPPAGGEPLLILPTDTISLEPREAWDFDKETARTPVGGWCQGAVLRHGAGRVAVFGEAAMFSAQRGGPEATPVGMNSSSAPQNFRFLLNTIHWLAGREMVH